MKVATSHTSFLLAAAVLAAGAMLPFACTHELPPETPPPVASTRGTPPPPRPNPLPPFYNPRLPLERRVNDLVSRLTLEEKVALMQMASPAIARLGIAPYDWWSEALHGVANTGDATVFPQAIGMAAAWDVPLHYQVSKVIGLEGRAKHAAAIADNNFGRFRGLDFWSPNVNIFRDPRWGRGQETYGEDPYLSGRLAIQFVRGLQGDDAFYFQTIATPKHFAVHSGPEPLRHRFDAVITDQDLYTTYLPQFEAAVREGHAYSVMSSYNALNGIPNSGNTRLLTDILRAQWGFNGYVVSDVDSVGDIFQPRSHAYVPSAVEASALAVKAGNDLNSGTTFGIGRGRGQGRGGGGGGGGRDGGNADAPSALASAVARGLVTEREVDTSLRRLMEARIRMGEFDPPGYAGNPYNKITPEMNDLPESDALAHRVADESIVLLKNARHTLPLSRNIGTIAVIGPNADALRMQYGNYNGTPSEQRRISILAGIDNAIGADHVISAAGARMALVTDRVALAEVVSADFLFTDASRSKHGLQVAYAANLEGLSQPLRSEVSETGVLKMPDEAGDVKYNPSMAAKLTGVLVPPASGDYQLGAKARDGFRILIDDKVLIDQMPSGVLRTAGNAIHLEKDRVYNVSIEFSHTPPPPGRGGFGAGRGGTATAPAADTAATSQAADSERLPGDDSATPATAPATTPSTAPGRGRGRGARGGRGFGGGFGGGGGGFGGGRGGPPFGASDAAPGITANAFGDISADPLFQLAWTKPAEDGSPANTAGQNLYAEAIELTKKADAVILVVGIDSTLEAEEQGGIRLVGFAGGDRTAIELPAIQENMIKQVVKAAGSKPVVLVNCSGSAIALNWENENIPAIIQAWYPGQRGDAVADVIFGKYNPAGRLPVTFYRATEDLPEFTDYSMVARTYRYFTKPVLYPFGHGLSYSTFEYSGLTAPSRAGTGDDVKVSVNVKNTSGIDGDEVVQCYINRDVPAIDPKTLPEPSKMTDEQATLASTPRKSLVGFSRVPLKAGESKNVAFTITPQQLSLVVGKDGKREVRPGNLQIQIGGSSAIEAGTLTKALSLDGTPKAPAYRFVAPEVK